MEAEKTVTLINMKNRVYNGVKYMAVITVLESLADEYIQNGFEEIVRPKEAITTITDNGPAKKDIDAAIKSIKACEKREDLTKILESLKDEIKTHEKVKDALDLMNEVFTEAEKKAADEEAELKKQEEAKGQAGKGGEEGKEDDKGQEGDDKGENENPAGQPKGDEQPQA